MPQTAPSRARRAAVLAALASLGAAALTVSAAARAQSEAPGQQIYIAGPGDRAGSDAARMSAMLAQPGKANAGNGAAAMGANTNAYANGYAPNPAMLARSTQSAAPGQQQEDEAPGQPGMITIPGPGERGRASAAAMPAAIDSNAGAGELQRVNVVTRSSAVAPVVVETAAPAVAARLPAVPVTRAPAVAARLATVPVARAPAMAAQPYPGASASAVAYAPTAQTPAGQEDGERIRATALAFLRQQAEGLPGKVSVTVPPVFPRGLAACAALEPFMPPGARMWGRTTVGVRCVGAKPWTLYVVGRVAVDVTYYVAARQIDAGQTLSAVDFMPREGDLASLPQTIITDPTQANGAVALARITAGLPLRTDMLRSASSVVIGQTVRVIAVGSNFTISSEGSVLNNGAPGQMVRVRTANGQIISGVVKDASTVQVQI